MFLLIHLGNGRTNIQSLKPRAVGEGDNLKSHLFHGWSTSLRNTLAKKVSIFTAKQKKINPSGFQSKKSIFSVFFNIFGLVTDLRQFQFSLIFLLYVLVFFILQWVVFFYFAIALFHLRWNRFNLLRVFFILLWALFILPRFFSFCREFSLFCWVFFILQWSSIFYRCYSKICGEFSLFCREFSLFCSEYSLFCCDFNYIAVVLFFLSWQLWATAGINFQKTKKKQ